MDWGLIIPVVAISIGPVAWVANNWVRAKHGFEPEARRRRRGRDGDVDGERQVLLLSNENERLTGQVSRLEERIAVLERIATDPAERTAREIEALRDR
ncbi:hypothetical protein E5673_13735 [Sphingomonas sp. PAMC26645]|jgi:hypothetical protein|uniref:hypothetical protein n=1 Tax=Sphingomonas sp. R86520 TaxID=3093859 RepID=UPI00109D9B8D|nr:hypothetical protein [Sphingomonas sp. PAMC26645]QCB43149.1 hypothetical protein E5673_13735 [Sphingomonas sp. PAMC26645]RZL76339.1 MAG: hypothetical protein EOP66_10365 [Sphingomonas sp.]